MGSLSRQRPAKRVTIKDVAQAAGVSVTTVSNVLNQRTEAMAEPTLLRIQEAILSLNYHPSRVARSLVTSQTATIGLIIAEIETPLFLQALHSIEPIARNAGYNVLLCSAQNLADEQQAVNLLLEKQVDGIIFLSTSIYIADEYLARLPLSAPPIVTINRTLPLPLNFDQIQWDNSGGIMAAVAYLVELGHRRIALLRGPASRRSSSERLEGYRRALQQHGLEYDEAYVQLADYEAAPETWVQATRQLLALTPPPTAILASNDIVAAVAQRTILRAGLRVPQDVAVIGTDNQPFCTFLNPALTTVGVPIIEAGQHAIELLLARLAEPHRPQEQVVLPCSLIVRESSEAV
ncbi:MAG: LacI family transcriptional regulator [Anaerolineales bacterium]|nr:LacI family transcriptional regulator [Anaerolineales bacterium]